MEESRPVLYPVPELCGYCVWKYDVIVDVCHEDINWNGTWSRIVYTSYLLDEYSMKLAKPSKL